MEGVLNDHTSTVHRCAGERTNFDAACGALRHVEGHSLESVSVGRAVQRKEVQRCGRCFDGVGGY